MTTNPMRPRRNRTPGTDARTAFQTPADQRVKLTIRISEDLRRDLHIQARIDDVSVNELLIDLITQYLSNTPRSHRP
mgnify:FL=1